MAPPRIALATTLTISMGMTSVACDGPAGGPSAPTPPMVMVPPVPANVSGTVWIHHAEGVRPYAGGNVYAWVEIGRSRGPAGVVVTESDGRYLFRVPMNSRLRLYVMPPAYQPCAVTLDVSGDATRDVPAVSDRRQLGASLPPQLRSQSPTLSGVVFEDTPQGRRGVSDVHVGWDSSGGGDLETATTLTDSEGRYVLCALDRNTPGFVSVSKPGYASSGTGVTLTADATSLDFQLQSR